MLSHSVSLLFSGTSLTQDHFLVILFLNHTSNINVGCEHRARKYHTRLVSSRRRKKHGCKEWEACAAENA